MYGSIITYQGFFCEEVTKEKFNLVEHLPRSELIGFYSSLNHILKGPKDQHFNYSLENQINLIYSLYQVPLYPSDARRKEICKNLVERLKELYHDKNVNWVLCTRTCCLYCLNEIIQTDKIKNEEIKNVKFYEQDYLSLFKFLLACNSEMLSYSNTYDQEITLESLGSEFSEAFMFKEIPNNQYYYIQNPINLLERGRRLFTFLEANYQNELNFFLDKYNISSPLDYLSVLAHQFFAKSALQNLHIYNVDKTDLNTIKRMDALSRRGLGKKSAGVKKFEFLEIKKSPLYRVEGEKTVLYIVMDNTFLIEKSYDLFYWDFYFDVLMKKGKNLKEWGGEIGQFFERYIDGIFNYSFKNKKNIIYKSTDDIKIKGIEYADFYIRRKRKILLIQAKRSYVPQKNYKEVNTINDFKNLDRVKFYNRFGLNQLVERSIGEFCNFAPIIDPEIPLNKVFIYPILLINEPIISFSVTSHVFNIRFEELLIAKGIDKENSAWRISRLIIMHINELEKLQEGLNKGDFNLDEIMQGYIDTIRRDSEKYGYDSLTTFDQYLGKKLRSSIIPGYLKDDYRGIIEQLINFNPH